MKRLLFLLFLLFLLNSALFTPSAQSAGRFVDFNDGTVLDTQSNLFWLKNANCFGSRNWYDAITVSNSLATGQCSLFDGSQVGDWHLPTIDELRIFTDSGLRYNDLNSSGFTAVQAYHYWSSSTFDNLTLRDHAWLVYMDGGNVNHLHKGNDLYVWPVRSGQFWALDSLIIMGTASFGNQTVGTIITPKQLLLNNTGTTVLPVTAITMTGAYPDQFTIAPGGTTPCSSVTPTLAAGEKCTLNLTFAPHQ